MNKIKVFIILFAVFTSILFMKYFFDQSVLVKSNVDGKYYKIKKGSSIAKADILANINIKINKFLEILDKKESRFHKNIEYLLKNYRGAESLKESFDNTTFTLNKGREIHICLDKYNNDNDLFFVVIHELAHIGSYSYGHNEEFVAFFKFLLETAIKEKMYIYTDYSNNPVEYCGIIINTTPVNI